MNEQELKLFDLLAIQIVLVRRVKMVFARMAFMFGPHYIGPAIWDRNLGSQSGLRFKLYVKQSLIRACSLLVCG